MDHNQQEKKLEERILMIRRVSKKTTGGNSISFAVLAVVGDKQGHVGLGTGSAKEVPSAIKKAIAMATRKQILVNRYQKTIPHSIEIKYKSARMLVKPAPEGTGLKVGSVVRVILDLAGIENASGKIMGSRNQIVNSYAVIELLKKLKPARS
jgi:small subunit ribosomal protein S5